MSKKQVAESNGAAKVFESVLIEVPIGTFDPTSYVPQHVDLQLTREEGIAMKRIRNAMCEQNPIKIRGRDPSCADVVRFLLGKVNDELSR